jgi:hypothetical protein
VGLRGLDRVLGFIIRDRIRLFYQHTLNTLDTTTSTTSTTISSATADAHPRSMDTMARCTGKIYNELYPFDAIPAGYEGVYKSMMGDVRRMVPKESGVWAMEVGRMTLLRQVIRMFLRTLSTQQSRDVVFALSALGDGVDRMYRDCNGKWDEYHVPGGGTGASSGDAAGETAGDDTAAGDTAGIGSGRKRKEAVVDVGRWMDACGLGNVCQRPYDTWDWSDIQQSVSVIVFGYLISSTSNFQMDNKLGTFLRNYPIPNMKIIVMRSSCKVLVMDIIHPLYRYKLRIYIHPSYIDTNSVYTHILSSLHRYILRI